MLTLLLAAASVFTASDMLDIQTFARGQPIVLSSDGAWVAYVLTDVADEWNVAARRPRGHVQIQRLGDPAKPLSAGTTRSSFPAFSPDGRRLAFFLEDPEGGQLAVWDRTSGQVHRLGERFEGRAYLAPEWDVASPRIVYALAAKTPPAPPPARVQVIRSSDPRLPGDAFFVDRRRATLATVDVRGGGFHSLTREPAHVRAFRLSRTDVLYRTPTEETFGLVGKEVQQTYAVPLTGDALPRLVEAEPNETRRVRLAPDESLTDPEIEAPQPNMYTIARPFMDLYVGADNVTATIEDQIEAPVTSADGKSVFFRAIDRKTYDETIYRYRTETRALEKLAGAASTTDTSPSAGAM